MDDEKNTEEEENFEKISEKNIKELHFQLHKVGYLRDIMRDSIRNKDWLNLYDCIDQMILVRHKLMEASPMITEKETKEIIDLVVKEAVENNLTSAEEENKE